MSVQMIPAYVLHVPNWVPPAMRVITVRATRDGVQTAGYKLLRMFDSIDSGDVAVDMPLRDGTEVSMNFLAEAVDGSRALMLFDSQPDRYGALRFVNLHSDLDITIDLNDGTGGGAEGEPAVTPARVRVDNAPALRRVAALEQLPDGTWRTAGSSAIDGSGVLELSVAGGLVYALGLDDYGILFQPHVSLDVGQRVRPSNFQGWLYQVTEAGQLPADEPEWWPELGDNPARPVGTARLQAVRYYQPIAHGPIKYELV